MGQSSAVFDSTLFLACRHLLVCKITDDYAAEQQIWRYLSAARHFCSAKILAGWAAMGGRGSSSQRGKSPRKEISRGNLLCAESGLTNLSYLRLLSVQKYVSTLNWYNRPYRAAWGARGAAAPLFPKESRENSFEGFSLGNFFLTADAVLLCAAKKNSDSRWRLCRLTDMGCRAGVGTTRLAGFCQFSPDPWVTHNSKKPHTVGSGK